MSREYGIFGTEVIIRMTIVLQYDCDVCFDWSDFQHVPPIPSNANFLIATCTVILMAFTCMPSFGQSIEMTRGTKLAPANSQTSFKRSASQSPQFVAFRDAQFTPNAQQQTPNSQYQPARNQPTQIPAAQNQPTQYQPTQYPAAPFQPTQYQPTQYPAAQFQPTQYPVAQFQPTQNPAAQFQPTQYPAAQFQPTQYPAAQFQPTQYPAAPFQPTQFPAAQFQPTQNPPAQNPAAQYPPTQNPPAQNPPTQYPPAQNQPTQNPPAQFPAAQFQPTQYPAAQFQPTQNPPAQNPPTQYQPTQNPATQYPAAQYPAAQYQPAQYPASQFPTQQTNNGAAAFNVPYLTGHSSLTHQFQNPVTIPGPQMMPMPNNAYAQQVLQQQMMQQQAMQQQAIQQQQMFVGQAQPIHQQPANGNGQFPTYNPQPVPAMGSPSYGGMLNSYVGQLLQNDCVCGPNGYGNCGPDGYNNCGPDGYGSCAVQGCFPRAQGSWFGSAGTVLMTRDHGRNIRLSYDSANPGGSVLSTRDANVDYQFGTEARFGRRIGCGPWAWEVGYWSILPNHNEHTVNTTELGGMLNSRIDFGDLDFTEGGLTANVNLWYNDAEIHQVTRSFKVHQVELNFLRLNEACAPCGYGSCGSSGCGVSGWNTNWTFGVRYMKIDENFSFNTDDENDTFGDLTGEVFYSIELQNHLIGLQLGGQSQYQITRCLSADIDLKAGLYGNHINHRSIVLGCQVGPAIVNGGPHAGQFADVTSRKDDLSFATELRIGLKYQLGCNVKLTGGYRAFAATSVALPEDQIPLAFGDLSSLEYVDSSGGLLLHGFLFGLEWRR